MKPEEVVWVYRTLLQREPEDEDIIELQAREHATRADFIVSVVESEEFRLKNPELFA